MKKQSKKKVPLKKKVLKKKFPIRFVHCGRNIIINKRGSICKLTIDNENIPISIIGKSEFVAAPHAPMVSHSSLEDLAIFVVDRVINMRSDYPTLQILKNPSR